MTSFNLADSLIMACSYGPRKHTGNLNVKIVKLNGKKILESFHEYFADIFGFPSWYGKNMDAWIDCMSDLDSDVGTITKNGIEKGQSIVFYIENYKDLKQNKEIYDDLIECTSFINKRRIYANYPPLIYLAF